MADSRAFYSVTAIFLFRPHPIPTHDKRDDPQTNYRRLPPSLGKCPVSILLLLGLLLILLLPLFLSSSAGGALSLSWHTWPTV